RRLRVVVATQPAGTPDRPATGLVHRIQPRAVDQPVFRDHDVNQPLGHERVGDRAVKVDRPPFAEWRRDRIVRLTAAVRRIYLIGDGGVGGNGVDLRAGRQLQ